MMIGTPTASSLWPAYLLTVFSVVAGFAVYDMSPFVIPPFIPEPGLRINQPFEVN